jgi:outer membrane protein OmpA-like peptidoglycan-associated protein
MEGPEGSSTLASSFTDMMTSLAVIFILLLVASLNNAQQGGRDIAKEILARLAREMKAFSSEGVKVEADPRDPLALLVIVPEDLLQFKQGKPDVPEQGREFLSLFIPHLARTLSAPGVADEIRSIVVEGHASPEGDDEQNLELSQKRSLSVVVAAMNALPPLSEARTNFVSLLTATGRGEAEPITGTDGKVDLNRSRRVIFKIRVRSLEQKTMNEIIGGVRANASK